MPQTNSTAQVHGVVKWFDVNKGYGFIARPGEKDVFVHITDVRKSGIDPDDFGEGDKVVFDVVGDAGKLKATALSIER